jgi:hypothetical protein
VHKVVVGVGGEGGVEEEVILHRGKRAVSKSDGRRRRKWTMVRTNREGWW